MTAMSTDTAAQPLDKAGLEAANAVGHECVEWSLEPGEGIDGFNMEPAIRAYLATRTDTVKATDEQIDAAIREWMSDDDRSADGFRRRMRAALAAVPASTVKATVKALEWEESDGQSAAIKPFGAWYFVHQKGEEWFIHYGDKQGYPSKEAAKAAAQSDYEARILSSLEVPAHPEPVAQEAVVGNAGLLGARAMASEQLKSIASVRIRPYHPAPSPEQGEGDLVQRLRQTGDPRLPNVGPSRKLYREAASAISALRARVAEVEARATPQAGASEAEPVVPSMAKHRDGCEHSRSPIWLCDCPRPYLATPQGAWDQPIQELAMAKAGRFFDGVPDFGKPKGSRDAYIENNWRSWREDAAVEIAALTTPPDSDAVRDDPFEHCAKEAEAQAELVEQMRGVYPGDTTGALGRDANKMRKLAKAIRALSGKGGSNG